LHAPGHGRFLTIGDFGSKTRIHPKHQSFIAKIGGGAYEMVRDRRPVYSIYAITLEAMRDYEEDAKFEKVEHVFCLEQLTAILLNYTSAVDVSDTKICFRSKKGKLKSHSKF
jgi:hypothetical protein